MPTIAFLQEKELLLQVASGNEAAYELLFNKYWPKIYAAALVFTKCKELAKDIAQEVFTQVWVKKEKLLQVEKFDAFLFISARNLIIDKLRKKVFTVTNEAALQDYFYSASILPYKNMEVKEMEQIIRNGITILPNSQRTAFNLSRFEGLKHHEIALQMGVSKESVKSYIVRAICNLRKHLNSHN